MVRLANLHDRGLRISRDVAIVLLGDFGFRLAEIFTRGMKGSIRHFDRIGMVELKVSVNSQDCSNVFERVVKDVCVCLSYFCVKAVTKAI